MIVRRCALAFLLLFAGCAGVSHGVPNLAQVDPGLWRGGEPDAEGWAWLWDHGVREVVQLDSDQERVAAVPSDMVIHHYEMPPSDSDDLFRGPTVDLLERAAHALRPGVFVHCQHGRDRTGIVVATYRRLIQGWTKASAIREAKQLGLRTLLVGLMRSWEAVP